MSGHLDTTHNRDHEAPSTLDALLARSTPPALTTTRVQDEVHALVLAAAARAQTAPAASSSRPRQGRSRRQRVGRRLVMGAGAILVAFAGVSAASPSAPVWLAWADWTPDATVTDTPGQCALLALKIVPADGQSTDDPAVLAARHYLANLDLKNVDYAKQLNQQRTLRITNANGETLGTAKELYSEDWLRYNAYTNTITQMVVDEVTREGFNAEHISIEGRTDGSCVPEMDR